MQLSIRCKTHDAAVVPAGEELHWIPAAKVRTDGSCDQVFTLDVADLYCTGDFEGIPDHEFVAVVKANDKTTIAFAL